jgi:hypothetical protein
MSDNWLQFVPTDPTYRPSLDAAQAARSLLVAMAPRSDEVNVKFLDKIEFFHPGSNWSGVKCNACGADAESWWKKAMATAARNNFKALSVTAPCCGAHTSLNDLTYVWPAGFASFAIEAMNPNIDDLSDLHQKELATCLGCDLRKIWMHI